MASRNPGSDWSFLFRSYVASQDERTIELMDRSTTMDEEVAMGRSFNDEKAGDEKRSRMPFHLLTVSMTMKPRGFHLIKNTKSTGGFEAWRQ
eukprot:9497600-Pyramimonas_sp.AAC.1